MAEQIISKRCSKCKEIKPLSEFHKDQSCKDGHRYWCKSCQKEYRQGEKGKAAEKRYIQSEKSRAWRKRYKPSEAHKANQKRALNKYNKRYPNRIKARHAVNNAIQVGKLPHPDTKLCHYCPAQAEQYHHHKGYAPEHWLDVVPVCVPCHSKLE